MSDYKYVSTKPLEEFEIVKSAKQGGDLISRQDAIEAMREEDPNCGADAEWIIRRLPSAERTGKWIEDGEWYVTRYRCSGCGKYVSNLSNYCPDCGARMECED